MEQVIELKYAVQGSTSGEVFVGQDFRLINGQWVADTYAPL